MVQLPVINISNLFTGYRKPRLPVPKKVWRDPLYFIAFGFGSGAMPWAPGTFGTLMAIPFYLLLQHLPMMSYVAALVILTILSSLLCDRISEEIHIHDHPGMCIDEFIGFFVTMINAPYGINWIILGFILFRLFDIWKPWPIYLLDRKIHGGFGMIIDDVAAGLYSCFIIQCLSFLI